MGLFYTSKQIRKINFMIDQTQINFFQQHGAICLKGYFVDWVDKLRNGIEKLISNPSPRERSYTPKDGSAPFFQDLCNWQRIKEFEEFIYKSNAGKLASKLMQSNTARFFHDHVLVKEPGSSIVTPWHQDQSYYCTSGLQTISFWIPLDKVSIETTLNCISGSHKWNKLHKPKRFDGTDLFENDKSEEVPDIDSNLNNYNILSWPIEPGDAIGFNFRTLHGAPANSGSLSRRRVFSARWVGDDAIFVDKKGKGSPPFDHLTLKDGEKLTGDDFPLIYNSNY